MTEPEGDSQAISVAELLARNGQRVGAGGGGRRRRGVKGGISVAELTGEFPAVRNERATRAGSEDEPDESAAAETGVVEAPVVEADAVETPPAETPVAEPKAEEKVPEKAQEKVPEKAAPVVPEPEATAAFSAVEKTDAVEKKDVKSGDKTPAKTDGAKTDDAPTVITQAFKADDRKAATGWQSAATAVLEPVPAKPLAHSGEPEPKLLSGQSVAGDLLRQGGDRPSYPEAGDAADPGLDDEGLDAENLDDADELAEEPSAAKQWAVLLGQGAVAVVAGALMFKGFEKLWDMLPMVALVLAVLVIVGLVAMVRILRRTDDITSLVIAVVAGVFVTLGPLAFLLSTS